MDIIFSHHTSLALLRAARWGNGLELHATDVTSCPSDRIPAAETDALLPLLAPLIGEALPELPYWVLLSRQDRSASDPRLSVHVRKGELVAGAYQELRFSASGDSSARIPDDLRVLIEGPALALVSYADYLAGLVRVGAIEEWIAVDRVIALGDELCGSYARNARNPMGEGCKFELAVASSREEIERALGGMARIAGLPLARRAIQYVADGSASPMETLHRMMETLPPKLVGLSIGKPEMNSKIEPTQQQRRAMTIKDGMRPDLYWRDYGIAIEHDGERGHLSKRGWRSDHERIQDYQVCGIKVFPATFEDVSSVTRLNAFAEKLCSAIAEAGNPSVGKRVRALIRNEMFRARQRELLAILLPPLADRD